MYCIKYTTKRGTRRVKTAVQLHMVLTRYQGWVQEEGPRAGGPARRHEHPAGGSPHGTPDLEVLHHHREDKVNDH